MIIDKERVACTYLKRLPRPMSFCIFSLPSSVTQSAVSSSAPPSPRNMFIGLSILLCVVCPRKWNNDEAFRRFCQKYIICWGQIIQNTSAVDTPSPRDGSRRHRESTSTRKTHHTLTRIGSGEKKPNRALRYGRRQQKASLHLTHFPQAQEGGWGVY
jgi:hypothetical protein